MSSTPSKQLRKIMKTANSVHVALYRISKGKFGNKVANLPVLLLTTLGRKSGNPHTNPIVYIADSQDYLVSASTGGMDWHPAWYLNLMNSSVAKIEIGGNAFNVQAVNIEGEERVRLYEKFKAASGNFEKYEKGTSRMIPVIRLIRLAEQPL